METSALNVLAIAAFTLLIVVTGGTIYLTAADWRDRRRRDQESRDQRPVKKR